ncbi:phytyl ester synthase 1, chloroplastic-like [Mercurialis annua]|uniref:phytyl ester synthase 1, chloroplastic-like n=1 Tax=Mercurialis annua TaxID=3986 RepID=UPI002160DFF9|nr:phytyl ester synthase 1, chloroplastic-like [Mercurialis annua]XP_050220626.1 phytyl ester synthase 1, chloroplastic-like [Mercurialis annua]
MASAVSFWVWPYFVANSEVKSRFRVRVQSLGGSDSPLLSSDSVGVNGASLIGLKQKNGALVNGGSLEKEEIRVLTDGGNGTLKPRIGKKLVKKVYKDLEVLWDDGYGTKTVKDYLQGAKEMTLKPDGGPPRWFSPVECGQPLKDSPSLLFLPGLDGVGLGLTLHHKALGKAFEVWCLHIPVYDRTPFEGLMNFVEETVRAQHALSPTRPIYLVGDSFGGCLALAVAARNPKIDLVLILVNPATSFSRSQLQPFLPVLEAVPEGLHNAVPYLLSFVMGNPLKMAMADIEYRLSPRLKIEQLSGNLTALLPYLSDLADILPKETLLWKLKLLKTAAAYANSRLYAVKAEVLVLASGADYLLPSADEAKRLNSSLQNCIVRHFKDNGHTLLLEESISLLTIIKGTGKYRCSRKLDHVSDFLPPSMSEYKHGCDQVTGLLRFSTGTAMFSTLDDGKIVRGLSGVPNKGPVIFIGYHMLMGLELYSFYEEFIREKRTPLRGLAHLVLFDGTLEQPSNDFSYNDWLKIMGAAPVTPNNLFKLLSAKSHVLLYPGGAREALHYKGEAYKLFWPDQPEFVRMAAKCGATIVPFGTVGEDDIAELVLDYNDLMKIPVLNKYIREASRKATKIRDESQGEVANQKMFIPGLLPKIPGRFYFLFGKPIELKGKEDLLQDRGYANELYLQVKSEVKRNMDYLIQKREEDPLRSIFDRTLYRAFYSPLNEVPAFDL